MDAAPPATPVARWRQPLVTIPVVAALGAGFIALRIMQRGELWLDRTYWLVACAAFGALAAAACLAWLVRHPPLARFGHPALAFVLRALAFAALFLGGMMAAFVLHALLLSGHFEPNPERPIRGTIVSAMQTMALFLISCPTYLLPWPLPALAGLAGWLILPAEPGKTSANG